MNAVRIFDNDMSMEFGIDKCAILAINKSKVTEKEDMKLPNNTSKGLYLNKAYKYLDRPGPHSPAQRATVSNRHGHVPT